MAEIQITQGGIEVLNTQTATNVQVDQGGVEVLNTQTNTNIQIDQGGIEDLNTNILTQVQVAQLGVEVLYTLSAQDVSQGGIEVAQMPTPTYEEVSQGGIEVADTYDDTDIEVSQGGIEVAWIVTPTDVYVSQLGIEVVEVVTTEPPVIYPTVCDYTLPFILAEYQIFIYDPTGERVGVMTDWRSLQFKKEINREGFFTLIIEYDNPLRTLFEDDGYIEIWRRIPGLLPWYIEFEAHIEDSNRLLFENGNFQHTIVGSGFNNLLARRTIAYRDGTTYARKSGAAETVMKEYVEENCGPSATTANNRLLDGVITGFTVDGDGGIGDTWEGDRAGKLVIEALEEIANFASIDYQVVGTGNATYEFRTYAGQLGEDKTTVGLDPTTGLNGAGNSPFIFSAAHGNVSSASLTIKNRETANAVLVYGQGEGLTRLISVRTDATAIAATPIAQREVMRGGGSQATAPELNDMGDEWLEKKQRATEFNFVPLDVPGSLYGLHYVLGDKVTGKLGDYEGDKRITSVTVTVSRGSGGEKKSLEMQDIPRRL
jgi:hypothetical protein